MPWIKKCTCDRKKSDTDAMEFMIVGSQIELRCNKCTGKIGWWDDSTKKVVPSRQAWSHKERLAMR
jgi:hypothetical protein